MFWKSNIRIFPCSDFSVSEFDSDVFIIHGESSAEWVMRDLLPCLEDQQQYSCYLPSRDLAGGEGILNTRNHKIALVLIIYNSISTKQTTYVSAKVDALLNFGTCAITPEPAALSIIFLEFAPAQPAQRYNGAVCGAVAHLCMFVQPW